MADAIVVPEAPGQTLYARLRTSSSASVSVALTEGTSEAVGFYHVTEASLVSAGLTVAGNYAFKIFIGSPSDTLDDIYIAGGMLNWDGSVALPAPADIRAALGTAVTESTAGDLAAALSRLNEILDLGFPFVIDDATVTPTQTVLAGDSSLSNEDDVYNACVVVPRVGEFLGIPRKVTAYAGATRQFTVASPGYPSAPIDGQAFTVIGRIE